MRTNKSFMHILISYLLVMPFLFYLTACSTNNKSNFQEKQNIPVSIMRVYKGDIINSVQLSGLVKPQKIAYAVAVIPGKVSSAFFEVGDMVKQGDTLFTVDSAEIEDSIRVLEEQKKVAEANLSLAKTGAVAACGSKYNSGKLELSTNLSIAENNYYAAKEAFDNATVLFNLGIINSFQYNGIKNQYNQTKIALDAAIEALDIYVREASVDAIAYAKDQLKQAQAAYDMLEIQIESAKKKLSYTRVTAPISGMIATKDISTGCIISNTVIPYTIIDFDTVQIAISVTEKLLGYVEKGQKLSVSIPATKSESFIGTIETVSPAVDKDSLTYQVLINITNNDHKIRPGMTARVDIITENHEDTILVPSSAIISDSNGSYVYLAQENKAIKRRVEKGITDGNQIEIIRGLNGGEILVVKGQQFLNPDDELLISEEVN